MESQPTNNHWYNQWWGLILILAFFYIIIPYYVWSKTKWNIALKLGITLFCILFLVGVLLGYLDAELSKPTIQSGINTENNSLQIEKNRTEAQNLTEQAEKSINDNNLEEARRLIERAKALDTDTRENRAYYLFEMLAQLDSPDLIKKSLLEMSEEDFELLRKGELKKVYIQHQKVNELFLQKMQTNATDRAVYMAEVERIRKEEAEKKRQAQIDRQFSAWDGSHVKLTRMIKESMNDPSSFEHVKTVYWDMGDHLIINITFRGKNVFNATVTNTIKGKASIDGEVIEVLEQY
jgi:hypothetical protein